MICYVYICYDFPMAGKGIKNSYTPTLSKTFHMPTFSRNYVMFCYVMHCFVKYRFVM